MAFTRTTETGAVCTYEIDDNGKAVYSDTEGRRFEGIVDIDILCAICQIGAMPYKMYAEIIARVA